MGRSPLEGVSTLVSHGRCWQTICEENQHSLVELFMELLAVEQKPSSREAVEQLAEEFVNRHRLGERPSISDFCARLPDHDAEIRDLFPALILMENIASEERESSRLDSSNVLNERELPLEEFIQQLEKSGILASHTLKDFLPPNSEPKNSKDLACELVRQKKLTPYQAEQISKGRGKSLVLGNYVLMETVGAGGMGQVYKARHQVMERFVALKILPLSMTKNQTAIARFRREIKAAAKISHPNIVTAHDADYANGIHFLVMELIDGSDLSALVKKNGPFSVEKAVNYVLQAAKGLEAAHANGIIHRDIKPSNMLLDNKGTVKLLDMGLARLSTTDDAPQQAGLTNTDLMMGTVDFMAPEQALDSKTADVRADVYSLGCSLYFLLTGRTPYDGDTIMKKLLAHREQPIPSLQPVRSDVPVQLNTIFKKMIAKKIEHRYQTITALIADLENIADLEISPRFSGGHQSASRKRKRILIGAAVASMIMLAVIIVSLNSKGGTPVARVTQTDAMQVALKNRSAADANKPLAFETAGFDQWVKDVSELPAEKQLEEVAKKLVKLNPGFDGVLTGLHGTPVIEKGVVTSVMFSTKNVTDISPVRAFTGLKQVIVEALNAGSGQLRLRDLSPLRGMKLQSVNCLHTLVSDLSPLQGMEMTQLSFSNTNVSDVSPLKGMPFECLCFWGTKVSDLSPLEGMKLTKLDISSTPVTDLSALKGMPLKELFFSWTGVTDVSPLEGMPLEFVLVSPENITKGIDVIRQMKTLKTIGISWDQRYPPDEFWQKYDAGEFKKMVP